MLGLIFFLLLVAGCDGGNDGEPTAGGGSGGGNGDGAITNGILSGHNFTVRSGEVFQFTTGGPLTAGPSGGTITFDEPITTLTGVPDRVNIQIFGLVSDGGRVAILAFGDTVDNLAATLAVLVDRTGNDYSHGFFWGLGIIPLMGGTFPPLADPAGTVSLVGEFHNDLSPAALIATWDPDDLPFQEDITCNPFPIVGTAGKDGGGSVNQGNGDVAGITFIKATISAVAFRKEVTGSC